MFVFCEYSVVPDGLGLNNHHDQQENGSINISVTNFSARAEKFYLIKERLFSKVKYFLMVITQMLSFKGS